VIVPPVVTAPVVTASVVAPPVAAVPTLPAVAPAVPAVAPIAPSINASSVVRPSPPPPRAAAAPAPKAPAITELDPAMLAELTAISALIDELDYFQILKITAEASVADIKSAFYRESRTYHPDRYFHLADQEAKSRVNEVYKRITEAYYVLRDDVKRRRYHADITSPQRAQKLRFTEASEVETKQQVKKEQEEQIGVHPKGRQFYATAMKDVEGSRWSSAERNLKMALTYEPSNARYKEKMLEVQAKLNVESKGQQFKLK
jgi:hypothetical protein